MKRKLRKAPPLCYFEWRVDRKPHICCKPLGHVNNPSDENHGCSCGEDTWSWEES